MSKIVVKAEPELNTLFLVLSGQASVKFVQAIRVIVESELTKLNPGFNIYNDSRGFQAVVDDSYDAMLELCKKLQEKQPSRIARLLNPYSRMIFNRISAQLGYSAREFTSVKSALEYLEINHQASIVSLINPAQ